MLEPNFTKVVRSVRKNVGSTQSVIELKLPTNDGEISQIYSVSAKSTIVDSDYSGEQVTFNGLVNFQAVYDSMGIKTLEYSAEFRDKFDSNIVLSGQLVITSNVIDVTSSVMSNGIKVVAIIEVVIDEIVTEEVNVLTSVGGQAYTSTKEIEYTEYIGKATEKNELTADFTIKNASRILMVTPNVCISKVEPRDNYLVVYGVLNSDICYQMGEGVNEINTYNNDVDFTFEVALSGIENSSIIQSTIAILSNEIKITSVVEDDSMSINLVVPVMYNGYVFNRRQLEVLDDLYQSSNYLSITNENIETLTSSPSVYFKDNISGTASISDTAPFIDEILGVCTNNIVLASSRVDGDRLVVEGIANATVVYYTKELGSLTSVQIEMPFSVENRVEGERSSIVSMCLMGMTARSKRGKEIEVSAELNVFTNMYNISEINVITNVTVGDEKVKDDCALVIYIVRPNQTVWEVAKDMGVPVELILEQNPEVELPLKAGQRLVVYTPQIMEF